jgi:hypothetical protein
MFADMYPQDNAALSTLIFGGDLVNRWDDAGPEPATLKAGMTEADFSNKNLGVGGAIIISALISHKDNGAMTSLHVGMNSIPEKEMKEIITIAMRKDSMKILCEVPIKDKTLTELDISGKNLGMEGGLVVAEYLSDNGAMTSLNLASNALSVEGAKIIATCLPQCT